MIAFVLTVHILIAIALVTVVLLQRSEGGALGIGGGSGSFMSGRGAANALTRTTSILAACFFATSITLTILAGAHREPASVLDVAPETTDAPASDMVPLVPSPLDALGAPQPEAAPAEDEAAPADDLQSPLDTPPSQ